MCHRAAWRPSRGAMDIFKGLFKLGPVEAFWKMYKMRTIKFGTLMGVDKWGNHYFENLDYPWGAPRRARGGRGTCARACGGS